jgi:hypothetical protein
MRNIAFLLILFALLPGMAQAENNGVSLGYGFGLFNTDGTVGQLEENRTYSFIQGSYFHEFGILPNLFFVTEPYLAYTSQPERGIDIGLGLFFRYYLKNLFFSLGSGGAYTSISFQEQGTHYVFILQAGVGYKWRNFFIEDRFRHYSNAGLATPNRSINANIISIGYLF